MPIVGKLCIKKRACGVSGKPNKENSLEYKPQINKITTLLCFDMYKNIISEEKVRVWMISTANKTQLCGSFTCDGGEQHTPIYPLFPRNKNQNKIKWFAGADTSPSQSPISHSYSKHVVQKWFCVVFLWLYCVMTQQLYVHDSEVKLHNVKQNVSQAFSKPLWTWKQHSNTIWYKIQNEKMSNKTYVFVFVFGWQRYHLLNPR